MILRHGVFLQNRYEILELIGSGGMSEVYRARCHKLNRFVAIKLLKKEFCQDEEFVRKFKMEAQAAAGLNHPNIVSIYDVVDEEELHYIVMELVEGITLKEYITKKGHLDIRESIGIAVQVAQGIGAAHQRGIIHRDVKPQNMILAGDGKVKVADFGIARAVTAQTISSQAMGSVHYISPEQARGEFTDARSDIYSLGITMYEMVTGRLPFNGDTAVSVALAHIEETLVPPETYNPAIPKSLEQIIIKCVEKEPENRYQDIETLIRD
ncbi:MAG: serine/threonine protein kinase, partial [Stomatobaculum sp.]|nr:serine/threonine protein kinase [Stomatobaculum sp.]